MSKFRNWIKLKREFLEGDYITLRGFLKKNGIPHDDNRRPKQTNGWMGEKKTLEKKALLASKQSIISKGAVDLTKIRLRQQRISRFMQLKGETALEGTKVKDVDEARKLVVSGMEQERRALGLEGGGKQSLTQINIETPKTNLDRLIEKLNYEGILELIAELKRLGTGGFAAKTIDSSPAKVEDGKTV